MTPRKTLAAFTFAYLLVTPGLAEVVPFDSAHWKIEAQTVEIAGSDADTTLLLDNGSAWLEGVDLANAEVSFEVSFGPQRGFLGLAFRGVDGRNYEHFYVRPHQSGNPDANQYTPVSHGLSAWQLYHGPGYSAPSEYPIGEWLQIRVVFFERRAEVFLGDSETVAVSIPELKRPVRAGKLGLTANMAPARFRHFRWRAIDSYVWSEAPEETSADGPPVGTIETFEVSDPLPEALIDERAGLSTSLVESRKWSLVEAERSGLVNLAAYADRGADGKNDTVLVRHRLTVDRPTLAQWTLGFSDRVRVYCDGVLAFVGRDDYRSRDYRYLGTIGWFDTVACSFDAGTHEIVFAVSESFGGWGLQVSQGLSERIQE